MNWILILICLMFAAMLAGPAHADTVTAAFPVLSNPGYLLGIGIVAAVVVAFIGLLWWAAGADRPKIKADLLHTGPDAPEKLPEAEGALAAALLKAAETPGEGEFYTFNEANAACREKEPTWFIREEYNRGVVKWRLYKINYQVKGCRGSAFWRISKKPFNWGEQAGYDTLPEAQAKMEDFVREDHELRKPRELLYYNRDGYNVQVKAL